MKKVQVPRNVAGSGNLGKNYKSLTGGRFWTL
jgi:hypothetical protein